MVFLDAFKAALFSLPPLRGGSGAVGLMVLQAMRSIVRTRKEALTMRDKVP